LDVQDAFAPATVPGLTERPTSFTAGLDRGEQPGFGAEPRTVNREPRTRNREPGTRTANLNREP
jgi:hypothetical protein